MAENSGPLHTDDTCHTVGRLICQLGDYLDRPTQDCGRKHASLERAVLNFRGLCGSILPTDSSVRKPAHPPMPHFLVQLSIYHRLSYFRPLGALSYIGAHDILNVLQIQQSGKV